MGLSAFVRFRGGVFLRRRLARVREVVAAHQVEPRGARDVGLTGLVVAIADQIVDTVELVVRREVLNQALVETDGGRVVLARLFQRVDRFAGLEAAVALGQKRVHLALLVDGVALEIQLAQPEHRVGGVCRVVRVFLDEALEQSDRIEPGFVLEALLEPNLAAVAFLAVAALALVLALQERHQRVAVGVADACEAPDLGLELPQAGDLFGTRRRAIVADALVGGVEERRLRGRPLGLRAQPRGLLRAFGQRQTRRQPRSCKRDRSNDRSGNPSSDAALHGALPRCSSMMSRYSSSRAFSARARSRASASVRMRCSSRTAQDTSTTPTSARNTRS